MEFEKIERDVLKVIVDTDPDVAEFLSIERITAVTCGGTTHELVLAVRGLKRKGFVTFACGDRVKATEMGIAALKSM